MHIMKDTQPTLTYNGWDNCFLSYTEHYSILHLSENKRELITMELIFMFPSVIVSSSSISLKLVRDFFRIQCEFGYIFGDPLWQTISLSVLKAHIEQKTRGEFAQKRFFELDE